MQYKNTDNMHYVALVEEKDKKRCNILFYVILIFILAIVITTISSKLFLHFSDNDFLHVKILFYSIFVFLNIVSSIFSAIFCKYYFFIRTSSGNFEYVIKTLGFFAMVVSSLSLWILLFIIVLKPQVSDDGDDVFLTIDEYEHLVTMCIIKFFIFILFQLVYLLVYMILEKKHNKHNNV